MLRIKIEVGGKHVADIQITRRGGAAPSKRYGITVRDADGAARDIVVGDTGADDSAITVGIAPVEGQA